MTRTDHSEVLRAWTDPKGKPALHRTNQDIVRMYMPDLARALDRLAKGGQR